MRTGMQKGFTLIEMIVVIVVTGIIAGIVAIFIQAPVQGYVDSARRAELTDIADTAVRRMARDVRIAVPNSVRMPVWTGSTYFEFLPTRDGGRYRAGLPGDVLQFNESNGTTHADTSFDIIGQGLTFATGDYIVVGSSQSDGSWPYDTTVAGVLRAYNGAVGTQQSNVVISNSNGLRWEAELDSQRFDVVDGAQQAVTYACEKPGGGACGVDASGDGTCQLKRYWKYGFNATQSAPAALGGSSAILADKVSACTMTYDIANQRYGLLTVHLSLSSKGESVSLYNEIHVNNAP